MRATSLTSVIEDVWLLEVRTVDPRLMICAQLGTQTICRRKLRSILTNLRIATSANAVNDFRGNAFFIQALIGSAASLTEPIDGFRIAAFLIEASHFLASQRQR